MNLKARKAAGIAALLFIASIAASFTANAQEDVQEAPSTKGMKNLEAEAMYYDALKAHIKGDDKEAEMLLQQTIKLNPEAAGAYYDLSRLAMKQNKTEKATEYIKKAVALQGGNKWYKSQYAEILAMSNKFEEAAKQYAELGATQKPNDEYLRKASLLYMRDGKYKEALAQLDKLIAQDSDEELLLQKQQIYLKMNDLDGAVAISKQLIARNPGDGKYLALLAELYDSNRQPEKALQIYMDAEKQTPDDPLVQMGLADHYKQEKNEQKYNEYIQKLLSNKALDAEAQLTVLVTYLQEAGDDTTQRKKGLQMAEQIMKQHSGNAQVLAVYGDMLSMNNMPKEAVQQYKKALDADPSRFATWQSLLYNYTGREDADSLIFYSQKALRLFPNQAIIHYLNGIGHQNKKDYPKAINAIKRAIDMQPEENTMLLADMYSSLGDTYNMSGQHELSDEAYEEALKLSPDNPSVLNNYSYYLSVRGKRLEDAEKMSKRSLELRPGEATFMDTYGWVLYKMGNYKKAEEYIQKAIDANPINVDATLWEHMGDIQYKLNNTDKAVEYWKKAKDKGADDEAKITKKIQERKLYE
jgi:tetratricopeptide (TPR) repeat protein